MNSKNPSLYLHAYRTAIALHIELEKNSALLNKEQVDKLKNGSREVLGCLAEADSRRTPKAYRYFLYRAQDALHSLLLDIEFYQDTQLIPLEPYKAIYKEYEAVGRKIYLKAKTILEQPVGV